ncbi:transposase [Endozoicomonas elysicola]|uniref:transposase n=1 Tax=Endozoicomonas elysicola TaxID=305900 RepID=UPI0003815FA3
MFAYKAGKKTRQYTNNFKVTAVLLTYKPNKMIKDVAEYLDIHPFMLLAGVYTVKHQ